MFRTLVRGWGVVFAVSLIQLGAWHPAAYALDHVRVGHLPVTGHAKFFVAKEYGIFEKEGIDAELIEFINSADGLTALRAGKLDVAAFGTTAPPVHIAQGADLRIIAGIMGEDAAIITTAENAPKIKSPADLKGKKVATVRMATGDAVLRAEKYTRENKKETVDAIVKYVKLDKELIRKAFYDGFIGAEHRSQPGRGEILLAHHAGERIHNLLAEAKAQAGHRVALLGNIRPTAVM